MSCSGTDLLSPICLRICSISSLPALGPEAKNTAGSPGRTRINRKVNTSTPNNAGSDDRSRLPARIIVAPRPVITFQYPSRLRFSLAADVAIVDLPVELVGVAFDRRGHDRVLVGLPQRDLRHLAEMDRVELAAVLLVLGLVRLEASFLRDRGQLGIVDRAVVPALIAGVEVTVEIIRRGQPGDD